MKKANALKVNYWSLLRDNYLDKQRFRIDILAGLF